jgi:hypothetical protein
VLRGTKYLFLKNEESLTARQREQREVLSLCHRNLKAVKALHLREGFQEIYQTPGVPAGTEIQEPDGKTMLVVVMFEPRNDCGQGGSRRIPGPAYFTRKIWPLGRYIWGAVETSISVEMEVSVCSGMLTARILMFFFGTHVAA